MMCMSAQCATQSAGRSGMFNLPAYGGTAPSDLFVNGHATRLLQLCGQQACRYEHSNKSAKTVHPLIPIHSMTG